MLNVFVCCDAGHHGLSPHLRGVMDLDFSSQAAVDPLNCYLLDVCVEINLLTFAADFFHCTLTLVCRSLHILMINCHNCIILLI